MAQNWKSPKPGRSYTAQFENRGRPLGGTDFLIAGTGGDFNVPIRTSALVCMANIQGVTRPLEPCRYVFLDALVNDNYYFPSRQL
jgi:hypothetical protein